MRYFIGFLVVIGLLIALILLLFTGGGGNGQPKKPKTPMSLADYASTDAVVRLSIDGPINANENHNAIRITVGQTDVTYQQIQGYEGTVVNQQVNANNQSAYSNFLYALGHVGFTQGDNSKALANEKGRCPLGRRYVFELIDGNGHDIQRYWATSCGGTGTYKGLLNSTIQLFQLQVPNYNNLTTNVSL